MLKRLYIDNYKCFVGFEYKPEPLQLILGANGSGKTSMMEVLQALKDFVVNGRKAKEVFQFHRTTRWKRDELQRFELDVELEGSQYRYALDVLNLGALVTVQVVREVLYLDDKLLFNFATSDVSVRNDSDDQVTYSFDPTRSALSAIAPRDHSQLTRFLSWFASLYCFRLDPVRQLVVGAREVEHAAADLHNYVSWYRHLSRSDENAEVLNRSLREAIEGFEALSIRDISGEQYTIVAKFLNGTTYGLHELSDGQRCLIFLYTILHFVIEKGGTVVIDEPENFISLREIQPWLNFATMATEDHRGQLLLISHSPELIDQLAPSCGVLFLRDGDGPVRVEKFSDNIDPDTSLLASELIARGWVGAER